nr:immunoglobulin light chain junction region [Macaca mulatta]MOY05829.1 immunoglobulin light chain junction region [Macaca mulatta]MOY05847.1 immunoglobulin light chain junction region [Macaca mulatta]MOY05981.1 immunoglobulin light chain junction region [Macaca mulatta]MOY06597.1 immunoglobulin light chain junction region [Macaca mulatta]
DYYCMVWHNNAYWIF